MARRRRAQEAFSDSHPSKRRRTDNAENVSSQLTPPPNAHPRHSAKLPDKNPTEKGVFPLMNLPAELRLLIYSMALTRDEPLLLHLPRPTTRTTTSRCDIDPANTNSDHLGLHWLRPINTNSQHSRLSLIRHRRITPPQTPQNDPSNESSNSSRDPITPALLRTSTLIYTEARQVLYAENCFTLQLDTGVHTLLSLHQRSRSLIRHVRVTVPTLPDLPDGFSHLVRVGLRYCWGLKSLTVVLLEDFPCDPSSFTDITTNIFANSFRILRWLPQGCKVILEGCANGEIRRVVDDEGRLMSTLDEKDYLKRQHKMPEGH